MMSSSSKLLVAGAYVLPCTLAYVMVRREIHNLIALFTTVEQRDMLVASIMRTSVRKLGSGMPSNRPSALHLTEYAHICSCVIRRSRARRWFQLVFAGAAEIVFWAEKEKYDAVVKLKRLRRQNLAIWAEIYARVAEIASQENEESLS